MNFDKWIHEAYREPEITNFSVHNMEVAYQAGYSLALNGFMQMKQEKYLHWLEVQIDELKYNVLYGKE